MYNNRVKKENKRDLRCAPKTSHFLYVQRNSSFRSVFVHDSFVFRSQSIHIPFDPFYVLPVFVISLHVTVYGFYGASMHGSSSCVVRRKTVSLTIPLQIVLALASHASLNHTFCLRAFLLLFF